MGKGVYEHYTGVDSPRYSHGLVKTRIYRIWANMKTRCHNPNATRYSSWGGRGIKVCDEWLNDFKAFYDWAMSHGYEEHLTIDRIDNNKGYSPDNCRWVSYYTQNRNKLNVPIYDYNGITFTQSDVFTLFGIKRTTFQARLKRGLSVKQALEGGECCG